MNARDIVAFRACLSDDCVVEDHRGLRTIAIETGEQYTEAFVAYMELAEDYCVEMIRLDAAEPWGVVTVNRFTGTFNDGAAFEILALACSTWNADGRTNLLALYEPQDREAALDRLMAADPGRSTADDDPLAIPRNLAVRSVAEPGWTLLAALGERTCLHHTGDRLLLHQVDEAGKVTTALTFDHADRRSAWDEVLRLANRTIPGVPERTGSMVWASNARDLVALREAIADECVFEDHRQLRISTPASPEEYVEVIRGGLELSPDHVIQVLRWTAMDSTRGVTLTRIDGTTTEGAPFEAYYLTAGRWDEEGRVTLIAFYEPEDLEAAVARLTADDPPESG
jgi:hypothetical protein